MLRKQTKRLIRRLSANDYRPLNRITLDRSAVLHNVAHLERQHPDAEIIPVLKGNAYGHGIAEVAEILNDTSCAFLAVDGYFEAGAIRDITTKRILVMGYILPENVHLLDIKRCSFVVQDTAGLRAFASLKRPVQIHMELNTGMNRLGLQSGEIAAYLAELQRHPNLHLEGVMTHLADADNELDESFSTRQLEAFDEQVAAVYAAGFRPQLIHIAQTAGSAKVRSCYANAIRLGIGAYGINPLLPKDSHYTELAALQPVLELRSTIIKCIELQEGDKVSYNCTFVAPKAMRIGVLPLGFYEGVPRPLSNQGCATHNGTVLPIVGRVCMNHTMIDLDKTTLGVGDEVVLIAKQPLEPNSIRTLGATHGLFVYNMLTNLSSSIRREIV
ncbi:MAG TPA: alanine racemase [Patescibacteria group bacterium]|nr:alanine racemase [Patescibacteria group bacterium]